MKTRIIFWLTSRCNLACPNCVYGVGRTAPVFEADWNYMLQAARWLNGIDSIQISGGEPMLHPLFDEWSPRLKSLFSCRELSIETNATKAMEHENALRCYDVIKASRYHPDINGIQIEWLLTKFPGKIEVSDTPIVHVPLDRRGFHPCQRGLGETAAYCNGKMYRCCVGPGPDGAVGIPIGLGWQQELLDARLPCEQCCFAVQ